MALPGARFCILAKRSFLSLIRCTRSNGTRLSKKRLNLLLAGVCSAAATTNEGVMVHVGSGFGCLVGRTQLAVLVWIIWEMATVYLTKVIVPIVVVVVVVTLAGVVVVVG